MKDLNAVSSESDDDDDDEDDSDNERKSKNYGHVMCAMMVNDMVGIVDWRCERTRKRFSTHIYVIHFSINSFKQYVFSKCTTYSIKL